MLFLSVPRFSDYAGPTCHSRSVCRLHCLKGVRKAHEKCCFQCDGPIAASLRRRRMSCSFTPAGLAPPRDRETLTLSARAMHDRLTAAGHYGWGTALTSTNARTETIRQCEYGRPAQTLPSAPRHFTPLRTRFMGCIVSPVPDRSPVQAIQELWGGNLPPFYSVDDLNHLLRVLVDGLWNRLTAHQTAGKPFKLTQVQVKPTREGVHHYALVRKQEIEGFMDGLFGPHEEMDLPESARNGIDALGEIRAMLAGAIDLLDDTGKPAPADELNGLADNLQALATILEKEVNTVILSCTCARRQVLAETRGSKPTVH